MVTSDIFLYEHKYKNKKENENDEEDKMFYEAEQQYQSDVRKRKEDILQNLLNDTSLMIDEKKKAKRLNWILLAIIIGIVGTGFLLLILNERETI